MNGIDGEERGEGSGEAERGWEWAEREVGMGIAQLASPHLSREVGMNGEAFPGTTDSGTDEFNDGATGSCKVEPG